MSLTTVRFQQLGLRPGTRLLDLGAGEGRHAITAALLGAGPVIALDPGIEDLRIGRRRLAEFDAEQASSVAFVCGSGAALPLPDGSLDCVICAEVLEHVPEYEQLLAEIHRVLRPGGLLAVSVPRYWPERICWWLSPEYHRVPGGHIRIFRQHRLRDAVSRQGFYGFARHHAHALHVPYWWLRCLFWQRGEDFWPVRTYHRLLVWDLLKKPPLTRFLEWMLNPLMGKSLVLYFVRNTAP